MVGLFKKKKQVKPKARKRTHAYAPVAHSSPPGASPNQSRKGSRPDARARTQSKGGLPAPSERQRNSSKASATRDSGSSDRSRNSQNKRNAAAPPNLAKPRFSEQNVPYQPEGFNPHDPRWGKFRVQISEGVPIEAIRANLKLHGHDPRIAEVLHTTQSTSYPSDGIGPTRYSKSPSPNPGNILNDDRYSPFVGQLKAGVPAQVVRANFCAAGFDNRTFDHILNLLGKKPASNSRPNSPPHSQPKVVKFDHMDPKFAEFRKMIKIGIPANSVSQKMNQFGFQDNTIQRFLQAMSKGSSSKDEPGYKVPAAPHSKIPPSTNGLPRHIDRAHTQNHQPPRSGGLPPSMNRAQTMRSPHGSGPPPAPMTKDRSYSSPGPPPAPAGLSRPRLEENNTIASPRKPPAFHQSNNGPPPGPSSFQPPVGAAPGFNVDDPEWKKFKTLLRIGVDPTGIRTEFFKQGYEEEDYKNFMLASGAPYEAPEVSPPGDMRAVKSDPGPPRAPPSFTPPMKPQTTAPKRRSKPKKHVIRQFPKEPEQPKQTDFRSMLKKKGRDRVDSAPQRPSIRETGPPAFGLGGPPPAPPEVVRAKSHGPPVFRPPPGPQISRSKPPEKPPQQPDFRANLKNTRKRIQSTPGGPPPAPAEVVRQSSHGPPKFRPPSSVTPVVPPTQPGGSKSPPPPFQKGVSPSRSQPSTAPPPFQNIPTPPPSPAIPPSFQPSANTPPPFQESPPSKPPAFSNSISSPSAPNEVSEAKSPPPFQNVTAPPPRPPLYRPGTAQSAPPILKTPPFVQPGKTQSSPPAFAKSPPSKPSILNSSRGPPPSPVNAPPPFQHNPTSGPPAFQSPISKTPPAFQPQSAPPPFQKTLPSKPSTFQKSPPSKPPAFRKAPQSQPPAFPKTPPSKPSALNVRVPTPPAFSPGSRQPTGGGVLPHSPRKGGGVLPGSPRQPHSTKTPPKRTPSQASKKSKKDMKALFAAKLRNAKKKKPV